MGCTMAVPVSMVILPSESVEVMGTGIATGVVGKVVAKAGEGVMMKVLDAGSSRGGVREAGTSMKVAP